MELGKPKIVNEGQSHRNLEFLEVSMSYRDFILLETCTKISKSTIT